MVGLVGGEIHKHTVYLDAERERRRQYQIVPMQVGFFNSGRSSILVFQAPQPQPRENKKLDGLKYPRESIDGWLKTELGEFFNGSGEDHGELEMSILEVKGGDGKGGLILQEIEIKLNLNRILLF